MTAPPLSDADIDAFIHHGFVRLERAFPSPVAEAARHLLWDQIEADHPGWDRRERSTWTLPVIRLPGSGEPPFATAVSSPKVTAAFDQIVGAGRWRPTGGMGRFPIRFPTPEPFADGGWHIDASIPVDSTWFANLTSDNRALLVLFLLSDVDERSGPTRLRVGSHHDVARMLAPLGPTGVHHGSVVERIPELEDRDIAHATGRAGDVYLCHPFLVHAAGHNRSEKPRFMANPGLPSTGPLMLERSDADYSPVELAIRLALGLSAGTAPAPDSNSHRPCTS